MSVCTVPHGEGKASSNHLLVTTVPHILSLSFWSSNRQALFFPEFWEEECRFFFLSFLLLLIPLLFCLLPILFTSCSPSFSHPVPYHYFALSCFFLLFFLKSSLCLFFHSVIPLSCAMSHFWDHGSDIRSDRLSETRPPAHHCFHLLRLFVPICISLCIMQSLSPVLCPTFLSP